MNFSSLNFKKFIFQNVNYLKMLHFLSTNFKMINIEKFSRFPIFAAIDKNFLKSSQKQKEEEKLANFIDENNILD